MRAYAGYGIDYSAFWNYYRHTSKVDYSQYAQLFKNCMVNSIDSLGIYYGSAYVNNVGDNLTKVLKRAKVSMASNGMPDKAIKHISEKFKKWLYEYYA